MFEIDVKVIRLLRGVECPRRSPSAPCNCGDGFVKAFLWESPQGEFQEYVPSRHGLGTFGRR